MPSINRSDFKYNAKVYTKKCPYCGVTFYANKPSAIYCSALCKVNTYNKRKANGGVINSKTIPNNTRSATIQPKLHNKEILKTFFEWYADVSKWSEEDNKRLLQFENYIGWKIVRQDDDLPPYYRPVGWDVFRKEDGLMYHYDVIQNVKNGVHRIIIHTDLNNE